MPLTVKPVNVIGAGLAGCEAAYQLSRRGIKCVLYDIKPSAFTEAHTNPGFAELVCSNSLKSNDLSAASGLLKQELRLLNSLCIEAADKCRVAAGETLAVDRTQFSKIITQTILNDKNIEFKSKNIEDFDENAPTIIATGPLTTQPLLKSIGQKLGVLLHFYDAAAPIISADSIDFSKAFLANRYNKGEESYVNCPLNKEEYEIFVKELTTAKRVILKEFEKNDVFEGCMPIEIMASRGIDTLRYGPLKPVGLYDKEGKKHYAVVQLRRENAAGQMYNLVGFQTNLIFSEQKRVLGLIPALKNAEFLRYGIMHRNSFIDAPKTLNYGFSTKKFSQTYIAGQLSGVEGYCESVLSGLISALYLSAYIKVKKISELPDCTVSGALTRYVTLQNENFQPMNANFGLLPPFEVKIRDKKQRKLLLSERALNSLKEFINANNINVN